MRCKVNASEDLHDAKLELGKEGAITLFTHEPPSDISHFCQHFDSLAELFLMPDFLVGPWCWVEHLYIYLAPVTLLLIDPIWYEASSTNISCTLIQLVLPHKIYDLKKVKFFANIWNFWGFSTSSSRPIRWALKRFCRWFLWQEFSPLLVIVLLAVRWM